MALCLADQVAQVGGGGGKAAAVRRRRPRGAKLWAWTKQRRTLSEGQRAVQTRTLMSGPHPGWDLSKIPITGQKLQIQNIPFPLLHIF
jgi:hypothetical protein